MTFLVENEFLLTQLVAPKLCVRNINFKIDSDFDFERGLLLNSWVQIFIRIAHITRLHVFILTENNSWTYSVLYWPEPRFWNLTKLLIPSWRGGSGGHNALLHLLMAPTQAPEIIFKDSHFLANLMTCRVCLKSFLNLIFLT